jgi:alpha-1,3/alpha-1,6-mannosyltransferase
VSENVDYHAELVALATSLNLSSATAKNVVTALKAAETAEVLFLLSVPGALKDTLLRSARLLVYTPSNEHFGIVPLEAMLSGVPVLAANTGGPTETVLDGRTGWLRDPADVPGWTDVMDRVLNRLDQKELAKMAKAGRSRVLENFGDVQMARRLDTIFNGMEGRPRASSGAGPALLVLSILLTALVAVAGAIWLRRR